MKLFFVVVALVSAGYYFVLTSETNLVMQQAGQLQRQYQQAIALSDSLSSGQR